MCILSGSLSEAQAEVEGWPTIPFGTDKALVLHDYFSLEGKLARIVVKQ